MTTNTILSESELKAVAQIADAFLRLAKNGRKPPEDLGCSSYEEYYEKTFNEFYVLFADQSAKQSGKRSNELHLYPRT